MLFQIFVSVAVLMPALTLGMTGTCLVSQWGSWSECLATKSCNYTYVLPPYTTFSMSWSVDSRHWDSGRLSMQYLMEHKEHLANETAACKANGSCPELLNKPSMGYHHCKDGVAGDIPCRHADMLSFVNIKDLGYEEPLTYDRDVRVNDIWGWFDPLTGDEYAIVGLTAGTSFVRITNPVHPVTVAILPSHNTVGGRFSPWRDIKVIGNYAYIASELFEHGIQIFDLRRLRKMTKLQRVKHDAHYDQLGGIHNLVSNEETDFLYAVGANPYELLLSRFVGTNPNKLHNYTLCNSGLHAIDVSDPLNPQFAGCFSDDGYTHDAQCVVYRGPDTRYYLHEICFCCNEDTLTIVDVSDKTDMKLVSKKTYVGARYTHQGAITEDWTTLLLDDELDEKRKDTHTKTYFWDIRNLTNPRLTGRYVSTETAVDHNQYILGNLTFQANYEAGLRILFLDIDAESNKYNLIEQAYFDVFPSSTEAENRGAWSVYPYFPSRNVVVSSIEFGMYVVRPDYRAMEAERRRQVFGERKRQRTVVQNENNAQCPPLVETHTCVPDESC